MLTYLYKQIKFPVIFLKEDNESKFQIVCDGKERKP